MGKAIYRTLSNEEALKEFGRSSFVFVGGTGLIPERVPKSNESRDQKEDGSSESRNQPQSASGES